MPHKMQHFVVCTITNTNECFHIQMHSSTVRVLGEIKTKSFQTEFEEICFYKIEVISVDKMYFFPELFQKQIKYQLLLAIFWVNKLPAMCGVFEWKAEKQKQKAKRKEHIKKSK